MLLMWLPFGQYLVGSWDTQWAAGGMWSCDENVGPVEVDSISYAWSAFMEFKNKYGRTSY